MMQTEDKLRANFSCPSCGGTQNFSPVTGKLTCVYCSAEVDLDQAEVSIVENDFDSWAAQWQGRERATAAVPEGQETGGGVEGEGESFSAELQVNCRSCGATTTFEQDTHAQNCPFCGTPLEQNAAHLAKFWEPNYIIPFRVAQKDCSQTFKKWMSGKWFAPSEAKQIALGNQRFTGMYLPFWTYDAEVDADYVGERGDEYTTTDSEGNEETHTRWVSVSGRVHNSFDDIRVPAVDSVPGNILQNVKDWKQEDYQPFQHAYMAGFRAQIYTIDFVQGYEKAYEIIKDTMEDAVREDIGGDDQRVHSMDLAVRDRKFKLLVLPFWLASYKYKDKVYQVVINGRTGKLTGTSPVSKLKVFLTLLAIVLFFVGLYYVSELL